MTQLVIIGGGPAGMGAAVAAYERGVRDILILERDEHLGGILQQCIHNGFGLHRFGEELTGPEYAWKYEQQIKELQIPVKYKTMVLSVSPEKEITATNEEDGIFTIRAKAIILAMGCRERPRGALNIAGTRPAGIYSAGTAQKLVNQKGYLPGKEVVILGSGDIGLIMARRMTLEGAQVRAVCELMPYSGGLARNIAQCLDDFGIPLKLSHTVVQIHGKERVSGVTIAKVDENRRPIPETAEFIPCDTLLLSVGLIPENELSLQAGIQMDPVTGGAMVDQDRQTAVPGIFACGNVLHVHDLVDFVSQEAEIAGHSAAAYIQGTLLQECRIPISTNKNIRYTVPQVLTRYEETTLYFRVADRYSNVEFRLLGIEQQDIARKNASSETNLAAGENAGSHQVPTSAGSNASERTSPPTEANASKRAFTPAGSILSEKALMSVKKRKATPGEMKTLKLKKEMLTGITELRLELSVEEPDA